MSDTGDEIKRLQERLDKMVEYQNYFHREINQIQTEINRLRRAEAVSDHSAPAAENPPSPPAGREAFFPESAAPRADKTPPVNAAPVSEPPTNGAPVHQAAFKNESGIEEFVGKNLFSLIGIVITILGVGIGAKYAIDRDLISPLARILLGYAFAGAMLGVAVWLKNKYLNFSAVLLSGALAIMYFLTYFAYGFYELLPQRAAFALMLVFTVFAVVAAVRYNRQVIAHVGLVGAYAVPFLLSENSGRADVLFGYMTIINFGILAISVVKFWKPLFYSSFAFTWLIYAAWFASGYRADEHFGFAFGFAFVFFLTFYLTFLSYKLLAKEAFNAEIVALVLVNSFVFYGFGYAILNSRAGFEPFLGAFTLANAALNFLVAFVVHRYRLGDRKNFYLAMAIGVAFVTLAVPVQFSGNHVTLLWTAEAAALFWIGRTRGIGLYENLSLPLMALGALNLLYDWQIGFLSERVVAPVFNRDFLTAILFAAAFGFIARLNRDERYEPASAQTAALLDFAAPTVFLLALYNAFRVEIGNYFHGQTAATSVVTMPASEFDEAVRRTNNSLPLFNVLWQTNYTMLFLAVLSFVNVRRIKSEWLGFSNLVLNAAAGVGFLLIGLFLLGELRQTYLTQADANVFPRGVFYAAFRYVCFAFLAALIYASYEYTKAEFIRRRVPKNTLTMLFDAFFHFALLAVLSSELVNLTDVYDYADSYKLGLSILWGLYSVLLIALGIVKRKAHLRFGAIALFAVTLLKLFFYDIADLDTISKTVIFVTLGILLLTISFLYNKYKDRIFERGDAGDGVAEENARRINEND